MSLSKFMDVYTRNLKRAVESRPDQYTWPVADVPIVAAKMQAAIVRGSYNKDGLAFKWTCKELGIKYTYTAISEYVKRPDDARCPLCGETRGDPQTHRC